MKQRLRYYSNPERAGKNLLNHISPIQASKMSACIFNPCYPTPKNRASHILGWARIWRRRLLDYGFKSVDIVYGEAYSIHDYDCIFLHAGTEQSSDLSINSFGGLNVLLPGLNSISAIAKPFFLLDSFDPPYSGVIQARCLSKGDNMHRSLHDRLLELESLIRERDLFVSQVGELDSLIVGDSHVASAWVPGQHCLRFDGKTLKGALNSGIIVDAVKSVPGTKKLSIYFGNIDVRFHMCRITDMFGHDYASNLIDLMIDMIRKVMDLGVKEIEFIEPLPIDSGLREVAKTAQLDGESFIGAIEQRQGARQYLIEVYTYLVSIHHRIHHPNDIKISIYSWPDDIPDKHGILLTTKMESGKSIHLSPDFYRTNVYNGSPRQVNA